MDRDCFSLEGNTSVATISVYKALNLTLARL